MRRRPTHQGPDERGISSVVLVVSLIGLFGAVMLSVDAGNVWSSRRNLITGTDATALENARIESFTTGGGCQEGGGGLSSWRDYLIRNVGNYVGGSETCTVHPYPATTGGAGYIVVEAKTEAKVRFGSLFGISDVKPYALSAAQYGFVEVVTDGLRPMGFCINSPDIQDALSGGDGDAGHGSRVWHLGWTEGNPDACGTDAPGNWGWFDFDAGGGSNDSLKEWVLNGYSAETVCSGGASSCESPPQPEGSVAIGGCDTGHPAKTACDGSTGLREAVPASCDTGTSLDTKMTCLMKSGRVFFVPLYSSVDCTTGGGSGGGGSNCKFTIKQFLAVRLIDFCLAQTKTKVASCTHHVNPNGSAAEILAGNYFDLEILENAIVTGTCCLTSAPGGIDTGLRAIRLCSVDHDSDTSATRIASRCGQ